MIERERMNSQAKNQAVSIPTFQLDLLWEALDSYVTRFGVHL